MTLPIIWGIQRIYTCPHRKLVQFKKRFSAFEKRKFRLSIHIFHKVNHTNQEVYILAEPFDPFTVFVDYK